VTCRVCVFGKYTYTHTRISIHLCVHISLCICIYKNVCDQTVTTTHFYLFFFWVGGRGSWLICGILYVGIQKIYIHTHTCMYLHIFVYIFLCTRIYTNFCEQTVTTLTFLFFLGRWAGQLYDWVVHRMWVFRKYIY